MPTSVTSEHSGDGGAEAGEFMRQAPAEKKPMAIVVEAESRRKSNRPTGGKVPGDDWCEIVRGVMQSKGVAVPEIPVKFGA